eukprot:54804-Amorphochlora_amoeboformis.AAC.1
MGYDFSETSRCSSRQGASPALAHPAPLVCPHFARLQSSAMALRQWVNDELQDLMGFSDGTTADYLIAMATKASSSDSLAKELKRFGAKADGKTKRFASELFSKAPRKRASTSSRAYQKTESKKKALLRKNAAYALLDDDSEDEAPAPIRKRKLSKKIKKTSKKKKRQLRQQRSAYSSDESVSEEPQPTPSDMTEVSCIPLSAPAPLTLSYPYNAVSLTLYDAFQNKPDTDEKLSKDIAREKDLRERDEYAERLRKRDEKSTKKVVESAEARKRREMMEEEQDEIALMKKLREMSRQHYLGKREKEQIEYLRRIVKDEEYLFQNEKLSKKEMQKHKMRKKLLDIVEKRINLSDEVDTYQMPEAYVKDDGTIDKEKREAALNARYVEEVKGPTEQEAWEDHQVQKAKAQFGSRDKKGREKYDFVFEDQIDFIQTTMIKGRKTKKKGKKEEVIDPKLSEREKMKKIRDSLPIFPYREQLLDAIDQYQ